MLEIVTVDASNTVIFNFCFYIHSSFDMSDQVFEVIFLLLLLLVPLLFCPFSFFLMFFNLSVCWLWSLYFEFVSFRFVNEILSSDLQSLSFACLTNCHLFHSLILFISSCILYLISRCVLCHHCLCVLVLARCFYIIIFCVSILPFYAQFSTLLVSALKYICSFFALLVLIRTNF